MPMASLSRWTMSYFAAALAFLLAAEALAVAGIGYPAAGLAEPATLVLVHLVDDVVQFAHHVLERAIEVLLDRHFLEQGLEEGHQVAVEQQLGVRGRSNRSHERPRSCRWRPARSHAPQ